TGGSCVARSSRFSRCTSTHASCRAGHSPAIASRCASAQSAVTAPPSASASHPRSRRAHGAAGPHTSAHRASAATAATPRRAGGNLQRLGTPLQRLLPDQRGFVLSAARSLIFNAVLAARVAEGSWERLRAGDLANLDGRGSIFHVEGVDAELLERCRRLEIHPSGPLWGEGAPASAGEVLELESTVAARYPDAAAACATVGMAQERRSLRIAVQELRNEVEPQAVRIHFRLARGCFATAVLAELIETRGAIPEGD